VKILGYEIRREQKAAQFETVLQRIIAAAEGRSDTVTPESCMSSPTVQAVVKVISSRLAVTPVHVYRKSEKNGRAVKEKLPDHPVARLLAYPNSWQTRSDFFADATSSLLRYGNFYAYKSRGSTGPIRELIPMHASAVIPKQDVETYRVIYEIREKGGGVKELPLSKIMHVRGSSRDYLVGDSPIRDVSRTIALEIAAEQFGWSFFANGAVPLMVFKFMQGAGGFKTKEQEDEFIASFQSALGGSKRHKAMLLPKGIETGDPVKVENDKAQFLETRKLQRTIIAGAMGVPPQYVGDLDGSKWNNTEQMQLAFTQDVIYPIVQRFEAAMERDLLTEDDYRSGVIIRFNLDAGLRADFKSRQEGLRIQRDAGVISPNEWREMENMNPIDEDDGGEDYLRPANMMVAGEEPEPIEEPEPVQPPIADLDDAVKRLVSLTGKLR
jgi:HK97 family phage portal protein